MATIEADIQKRKERAERFGTPFEMSDLDKRRLECAKTGKPMPGSKEEAEARRAKKMPKPKTQRDGDKSAGRDARFQNQPKSKAKKNKRRARRRWRARWGAQKTPGDGKRKADDSEAREAKKKKRAEAFGTVEMLKKLDPEFEAKLAARAARFASQ